MSTTAKDTGSMPGMELLKAQRDQLRAALDRITPCLRNWMEIADDEDKREEDDEALIQALIALRATDPSQSTLPL